MSQTNLYQTVSPSGIITHKIYLNNGKLYHEVLYSNTIILAAAALGLKTSETDFFDNLSFISTETTTWDNTYVQPTRKKSVYRDHPVQRSYIVSKDNKQLTLIIRVYDDGIAFRYYIAGPGGTNIENEYSEYNLPSGTGGWGQPWKINYESQISYYSAGTQVQNLALPFLATYNNQIWALYSEANVANSNATYCPSVLTGNIGGHLQFVHAPDPGQTSLGNNIEVKYPFYSPWRTIIIADNLDGLVNSTLIQNVNPVSKIDDVSWIHPGRVAWSWWSTYSFTADDNLSPNSIQRQMTFQQQKDYVDFASAMGWEYVTVDAGWVYWKDGTVQELCEYAATKNVGIFLWASYELWSPYGASLMNIKQWADWGVVGIKIDIIEKDSQVGMAFMEGMAMYCASLGLMLSLHSTTKPGGEERTWPNLVTYEAVSGNEHYWLYWPPVNTAYHNCVLPFTRNVLGSMDYTPVALSNRNKNTSQGHQLAQSVVYESGLQHFADSIDVYAVWLGTEFLSVVQAAWDETRVLEGFPGNYVTFARRKGDDWCIGAMTTTARDLTVNLSSLDLSEGNYNAYIYKDGSTRDFLVKDIKVVTSSTTISVPMLESGGCAIYISKTNVPTMPADPYTIYEAEAAQRIGTAAIYDCENCRSGKKVGYLGNNNGELIFTVNVPQAGIHKARLYYLSEDPRTIKASVNGGPSHDLEIAYGSGSWNNVRIFPTSFELQAGNNTVRFWNDDWAPDIDKLGILMQH